MNKVLCDIFPLCLVPIILEYHKPYAITFDGYTFTDLVGGDKKTVNHNEYISKVVMIPQCNKYITYTDSGLSLGQLSPPNDAKEILEYNVQYPLIYQYSHRKIYSSYEFLTYDMIDNTTQYLTLSGIPMYRSRLYIVCVSNNDEYIFLSSLSLGKRDSLHSEKYNIIVTLNAMYNIVNNIQLVGKFNRYNIVNDKSEETNLAPLGFLDKYTILRNTLNTRVVFVCDDKWEKCMTLPISTENILSTSCYFDKFILTYPDRVCVIYKDLRHHVIQGIRNLCFLC